MSDLCACGHVADEHSSWGPCEAWVEGDEYGDGGEGPLACPCVHFEVGDPEATP